MKSTVLASNAFGTPTVISSTGAPLLNVAEAVREDFQRAAVATRSLADEEGSRMVRRRVAAEFRRAVLADEGGLGKGRDESVVPVATVGIVVVGFSGEDIVRISGLVVFDAARSVKVWKILPQTTKLTKTKNIERSLSLLP